MTHSDLHIALLDVVRNYWRTRNAVAILKISDFYPGDLLVEYSGIGSIDGASPFPQHERLDAAMQALHSHAETRMCSDAFLLLIAGYERFLSYKLKNSGASGEGTLGNLQNAVESRFALSGTSITLSHEIRERRNCLIHRSGLSDAKYIAAAATASPLSQGHVHPVVLGVLILPTPEYLSYAADVLLQYGRQIP
jgi:hypothetical protein